MTVMPIGVSAREPRSTQIPVILKDIKYELSVSTVISNSASFIATIKIQCTTCWRTNELHTGFDRFPQNKLKLAKSIKKKNREAVSVVCTVTQHPLVVDLYLDNDM